MNGGQAPVSRDVDISSGQRKTNEKKNGTHKICALWTKEIYKLKLNENKIKLPIIIGHWTAFERVVINLNDYYWWMRQWAIKSTLRKHAAQVTIAAAIFKETNSHLLWGQNGVQQNMTLIKCDDENTQHRTSHRWNWLKMKQEPIVSWNSLIDFSISINSNIPNQFKRMCAFVQKSFFRSSFMAWYALFFAPYIAFMVSIWIITNLWAPAH